MEEGGWVDGGLGEEGAEFAGAADGGDEEEFAEVLLQADSALVQEVFLELEHHLPTRKFQGPHLSEFATQFLVQVVEFAVSSRDDPSCGWHLVAGTTSDFDDICEVY